MQSFFRHLHFIRLVDFLQLLALTAPARSTGWAVPARADCPSAVEYRPAEVVSQPLIVQD